MSELVAKTVSYSVRRRRYLGVGHEVRYEISSTDFACVRRGQARRVLF